MLKVFQALLVSDGVKMPPTQEQSTQIQRTVRFYRIYEQKPKEKILLAGDLWKEGFESLFQGKGKYLKIGDVKFQIHQGYADLLVISMHKPIDLMFATQEDESEGTFKDVTEEELEAHKLAYASVAVVGVHKGTLHLAVTKGGHTGSPGHKNFKELLVEAIPLQASAKWVIEGIMHRSDRERLKRSQGVSAFSGMVVSQPSQGELAGLHYGSVIERLGKGIADYVGTEIELEVSVKLKNHGRAEEAKARDLALITNFDTNHRRKPKATARGLSGEELLTLAQHDFASKIYLDINDVIGARFSALLEKSAENFQLNIAQALES